MEIISGDEMNREAERGYEMAVRALSARDMTIEGMRQFLGRKKIIREAADSVLERLIESGLLDDARFAERFVERNRDGGQSKQALRDKLRQKGIDREIIDGALAQIGEDEQLDAALSLALTYARKYADKPPREGKAKTAQALGRRGFKWDMISSVLDRVFSGGDEDEDFANSWD